MVDKMVVLELVALAVVLQSPYARAQQPEEDIIAPYQTFPCYTDHCNVDRLEYCSSREKRCISCSQHMGDCQNPEKASRMPSECIIYCRKRLQEKELRQQHEEQMEKAAQACKDKMEEMQQNSYTSEEPSTKPFQTGGPPCMEYWVVTLVGIVAALGWGMLTYMWVESCRKKSSARRGERHGTSPATRGNPPDKECLVEMTGQSNGDLKLTDAASSGFGSKSTTFTKSKDSGLGEPRTERETARKTVPISGILRSPQDMEHVLPSDFINLVEKAEHGSEQPQSRGHQLHRGQHPMRQQGQRDQQQEEEEQRLLEEQQGEQDHQQQQQQHQLHDRHGLQSPQGSGADMGETSRDVWQPRRPYQDRRRGVPPESDSSIHRNSSGHGASSGCLANAGTSPQASGQQQSQPARCPSTCEAYKKLTQVNPTNNT